MQMQLTTRMLNTLLQSVKLVAASVLYVVLAAFMMTVGLGATAVSAGMFIIVSPIELVVEVVRAERGSQ